MDKEQKAIERIKTASEMSLQYYGEPLVCTYSGGKDSAVMLELFKRSGVPFEVLNSHTTADAPDTVYHIRKVFRDLENQGIKCTIDYHKRPDGHYDTMWNLIPRKLMPPTRNVRYCCSVLKEGGGANRMIATGVRWAESASRQDRDSYEVIAHQKKNKITVSDEKMLLTDNDDTRKLFEKCQLKAKTIVNPIIDWEDDDIWDFYSGEIKLHNPVYEMGCTRCGCIGCPLAGKKARELEFRIWPQYKKMYELAFERMLVVRKAKGKETQWRSGKEVFHWWMEDANVFGQLSIYDFPEYLPD